MCGVFGVANAEHAAKSIYLGLFALQHRGQESAGISTVFEGKLLSHRGAGLVSDVFTGTHLEHLNGNNGVGHVRYSTAGGNSDSNIQPLLARIGGAPVALAHNGNIVNAASLRVNLEEEGAILQGTADTEILLHIMARSKGNSFVNKLLEAFSKLVGAYSILIQTPTHLYAAVDGCGYRPLVLGKFPASQNGFPSWAVSSETCALDLVGSEFIRDIAPGELLSISLSNGELCSFKIPMTQQQSLLRSEARCSFEHIYFARPDSLLWQETSGEMRHLVGRALAKEKPVMADMVIAVPDSGIPMAMGYAQESGLPYKVGFIRNHYVGRTFIEPSQAIRNFSVRLKLNPVKQTVRGKRIIVVDDSIVRGTTSKKIIELLREAGAAEVHMRIGSPPVRYGCYYGIDTPKRNELLAQRMSLEEMKDFLHADSIAFLSEQNLVKCLNKNYSPHSELSETACGSSKWCVSCFSGRYQDSTAQSIGNPEGKIS